MNIVPSAIPRELLLIIIVAMVDLLYVYACFVMQNPTTTSGGHKGHARSFLVPSQVIKTDDKFQELNYSQANDGTESKYPENSRTYDSAAVWSRDGNPVPRRRPPKKKKRKASNDTSNSRERQLDSSKESAAVDKDEFPNSGNQPDVYWRSIPMSHLRQHPNFHPLPPPETIRWLDCLEDVRLFRQDSWQWDTIRNGRCSTSIAAAMLGFFESMSGEILGVPKSWRRPGAARQAFVRLRMEPIRTLERMNEVLCKNEIVLSDVGLGNSHDGQESRVWDASTIDHIGDANTPFRARYVHETSDVELKQRRKLARSRFASFDSVKPVRLAWGNAQEATALLTALNYFATEDPGVSLKEVGMCGAGLQLNSSDPMSSSLLVGASPDAVLCHSDGRIEALEVKNHCPFVIPFVKKGKSRRTGMGRFVLGDMSFDRVDSRIFPHLIPQLMMEMLCLGPECKSVVVVRQTATKGALILRLRRDDEWIDEMMYFLSRFHDEHVMQNCLPKPNFFLTHNSKQESARYRRFLNKTLEVRNKTEVVSVVPQEMIQRVSRDAPLFLDY